MLGTEIPAHSQAHVGAPVMELLYIGRYMKHICPVHGFLSAGLAAHSQGMSHDICLEPTAQVAAAGKSQGMRGRHLAPLLPAEASCRGNWRRKPGHFSALGKLLSGASGMTGKAGNLSDSPPCLCCWEKLRSLSPRGGVPHPRFLGSLG